METVRILIVEDEPIIASNLAMYLNNNDYTVSGMCYDALEAEKELKKGKSDFVIVDINLGEGKDGIELADIINKQYNLPFVFLTSYSDKNTIDRAKKVNPMGFVVKPFNDNTLLATIEIALSNHAILHNKHVPNIALQVVNKYIQAPLTEREFEVLSLIYEGKTNQQIIGQLFVSINTLKKHINNAYEKLDVENRTAAITKLRNLMLK